jgi:hypothetical protein
MWVHPKVQCFFLQWTILIGPSQKNHDTFNIPKIEAFSTNMGLWYCFPLATYIQYKNKPLSKGYGTNCDVIIKNILDEHF